VASWLICDHRFQRRYGIGFDPAVSAAARPRLRSGYLKRGATIEQLAQACGIDPPRLARTVAAYNEHARRGEDPGIRPRLDAVQPQAGRSAARPQPCVAPIEQGPSMP
jgi:hypothetical protein